MSKTWEEEAIERENKFPPSYQCPKCMTANWKCVDARKLLWECQTCTLSTIWSETYLHAFWEGYKKGIRQK